MARALVGLGATQRAVSIDRFAEDLRALVRRLSDVQPEVHATTIHYGKFASPNCWGHVCTTRRLHNYNDLLTCDRKYYQPAH